MTMMSWESERISQLKKKSSNTDDQSSFNITEKSLYHFFYTTIENTCREKEREKNHDCDRLEKHTYTHKQKSSKALAEDMKKNSLRQHFSSPLTQILSHTELRWKTVVFWILFLSLPVSLPVVCRAVVKEFFYLFFLLLTLCCN